MQLTDTSFFSQIFIQHTFFLHYFKLLPILNVKIILFQHFQHTSLKKSARFCLQNNSAMHFQNLGDRFSLLGLMMIFYWSPSNHWNSNILKIFWQTLGNLKENYFQLLRNILPPWILLPIIGKIYRHLWNQHLKGFLASQPDHFRSSTSNKWKW